MGRPNKSGIDWSDPAAVAAYKRQNARHHEYNRAYYEARKKEINRRIVERQRRLRILAGKAPRLARPRSPARGRRRGEDHPRTTLTDAAVRAIRHRKARGDTYEDIAKDYGLQRAAIYKIVKRLTWGHVAETTDD